LLVGVQRVEDDIQSGEAIVPAFARGCAAMKAALLIAAVLLVGAAPEDDAFERAVSAIARGSHAAAGRQLPGLRVAARDLRASGAAPADGREDLAARWLRDSHAKMLPAERDRALGPGYRVLGLASGKAAQFEQTFLAGQRARVAVVALRAADFAVTVEDDDHQTVCSGSPRQARCDWVPGYTARFRIGIRNPGAAVGQYYVIVQ
jgi:hypothetical protein